MHALALLLLVCLLLAPIGKVQTPIRILILNELRTAYPGINLIDQSTWEPLETSFRSVKFYQEFLGITLFADLADPPRSREFYICKSRSHLRPQGIGFSSILNRVAAGSTFPSNEASAMLTSAANRPSLNLTDVALNLAEPGGKIASRGQEGRIAAKLMLRMLARERKRDTPRVNAATFLIVNSEALKRWNLKGGNLPLASIVLSRAPTLSQAYDWYIWGGLALLLAQTSWIVGLLWQRGRRRKAESELVVTYHRLRTAMESAKSVSWDWDVNSGQVRCFGDLPSLFGIPLDSYSGNVEDFRRLVYPEDQGPVWQAVVAAKRNRTPFSAEFRVIRDDQAVRWISARGNFYYGNDGAAERMLGMAVDITGQELSNEARLRHTAIVESSPDAIISMNLDSVILSWNDGAKSLFGYTEAEAIGQPIKILIPDEREESDILQTLTKGKCVEQHETTGITKTGARIDVSLSIFPIRDTAYSALEYALIARDVSERHRVESAIREAEKHFRLVANTAPVMIWMAGTDRMSTYFNKPWLDFTGRPLEAELGTGWAEGVHPEDLEKCLKTYHDAFEQRQSFEMHYRLRRHDGEYRWVLDIGVPRFDASQSFAGFIGSCIDDTNRRIAEEALTSLSGRLIHAQEEERKRIAREIHDDYNQRLAVFANELEELNSSLIRSSPEAQLRVHRLWEQVSELGADLHSLSHGLHSSTLESLGLVAGIRAFCKEFSLQQEIEVQFSHHNIPRHLPDDVSLCFFRIVQEGLRNVKRHSGASCAEVRLEGLNEQIHLTVSDQGRGFDVRRRSPESGIGVRSMEERLRSLGGRFEIHSRPAKGTRIDAWLRLQVSDQRAS